MKVAIIVGFLIAAVPSSASASGSGSKDPITFVDDSCTFFNPDPATNMEVYITNGNKKIKLTSSGAINNEDIGKLLPVINCNGKFSEKDFCPTGK